MSNYGSRLLGVGVCASAAFFALAGGARAITVHDLGNDAVSIYLDHFPKGLGPEDKIFLDHSAGTTVTGQVGPTGTPTVDFTSGGKTLRATKGFKNGEITSHPKGDDGSSGFHKLTITVPGYTFEDFLFNVDLLEKNDKSDLTIKVYDGSDLLDKLTLKGDLDKKGDDLSFLLLDNLWPTDPITSIVLYSKSGFEALSHFQISDLVDPPATPIPGAVWLFGTVLAWAAGIGRWRKRHMGALAA